MAANEHFRFSPRILSRLGEELVPNADQGILELVKNAYDADARQCSVELTNTEVAGGTVVVTDDGVGMTRSDIVEGWLVLGTSSKEIQPKTALGRLPVGNKGLGRLAALRLGALVEMTTRPQSKPGREYLLKIDWTRFDNVSTVDAVDFDIEERRTTLSPGTTLTIRQLKSAIGRKETHRLARALLLLADPFATKQGFKPLLVSQAFKDLEARVQSSYFDEAEFHLQAELTASGIASARILDWAGREIWTASHQELSKTPYAAPPAKFELWVFLLQPRAFGARVVPLADLREWLSVVGGVHLYHRGMRVYPYGEPGHDWLEMNLARSRSPELKPSTNTSVGRMQIEDPDEHLRQKTDRSGFIENDTFREIKRFAQDALAWMAKKRVQEREQRRQNERNQSPSDAKQAKQSVETAISKVPAKLRPEVERAFKKFEAAQERETLALREDLELYRTLGTVGTTIAVFAHETSKPVTQIEKMADVLSRHIKKLLANKQQKQLFSEPPAIEKPIEVIRRAVNALRNFANLPLHLLDKSKRRSGRVDIHLVLKDLEKFFEPFLLDSRIELRLELKATNAAMKGSVASLEAVLTNLITNAINAFNRSPSLRERILQISTADGSGKIILTVADSGPGIQDIDINEIWLPGHTTTPGGTGLGLTIVRDAVADLGGEVSAEETSPLGGARFTVVLPSLT